MLENVEVGMSMRKVSPAQRRLVLISLDMVLEKLQRLFIVRVPTREVELLTFNLRYLFYALDALYAFCLPELLSGVSVEVQTLEEAQFVRYATWQQLQEIERVLERIEPLCCLLSNTIVSLMEALNRTCLIPIRAAATLEQDDREQLDEQLYFHMVEEEQWQRAIVQFGTYLQCWRSAQHASFVSQFAQPPSMLPMLRQIDMAFEQIAASSIMSFGEILPGFQALATSDEATMTLLMDLLQRIDQVLLQLPVLNAPLHTLSQVYAVAPD